MTYNTLQMPNSTLATILIPDEALIRIFENIGNEVSPNVRPRDVRWRLTDDGPETPCSFADLRLSLGTVLEHHGQFLRYVVVTFGSPNQSGQLVVNNDPSAGGKIDLNANQNWSDADRNGLIIAFKAAFSEYQRATLIQHIAPEIANFYTRREETLLRLEELHRQILFDADAQRRTHDEELTARRRTMDEELKTERATLDADYQTKLQQVQARDQALTDRENALERADNTHARRKLRQDLKGELKNRHEKFTLTRETVEKRRPAMYAFYALILGMAGAAIFSGLLLQQTQASSLSGFLTASIRFGLVVSGFAAAVVYFIRWNDRWAQAHAEEEFRLKRLDLDVDRASWLVEMMLEWRGAEGRELPKELVDKLAAGLFEDAHHASATHPVEDALAALLSAPAGLKLNYPGGELSLDKRSVDKAKAATA